MSTTDGETTQLNTDNESKEAPVIEKKTAKATSKKTVARKTAKAKAPRKVTAKKAPKAPKTAKAEKPAKSQNGSLRAALLATPYEDRFKGKFPAGHPLAIALEMLGGVKGGKTVKLAAFEKAFPAGFAVGNTLANLDAYATGKYGNKPGASGFGMRVKTNKADQTVTMVPDKK